MPPRPATPHAAEILGTHWEDVYGPAEITASGLQFDKAAAEAFKTASELTSTAMQLGSSGTGTFIETASGTWSQDSLLFVQVGELAELAAGLTHGAATAMMGMLSAMAEAVETAEAEIITVTNAAVAAGQDPQKYIREIIDSAKARVAAYAAAFSIPQNPFSNFSASVPPSSSAVDQGQATAATKPVGSKVVDQGQATAAVNPVVSKAVDQGQATSAVTAGGGASKAVDSGFPTSVPATPGGTPAVPGGATAVMPGGGGVPSVPGGAPSVPGGGAPSVPSAAAPSVPGAPSTPAVPGGVPSAPSAPSTPSISGLDGGGAAAAPAASAAAPSAGAPAASPAAVTPGAQAPTASAPSTGAAPVAAAPMSGLAGPVSSVAGAAPAAVAPVTQVAAAAAAPQVAAPVAPMAAAPAAGPVVAPTSGIPSIAAPAANVAGSGVPMAAAPSVAPSAPAPTYTPTPPGPTPPPTPPPAGGGQVGPVSSPPATTAATPSAAAPAQQQPAASAPVIGGQAITAAAAAAVAAPSILAVQQVPVAPAPIPTRLPTPSELVRDIVRSLIAALDGTPWSVESGLQWAAMATSTQGMQQIWITSSDGRWLPPRLYLPPLVALPWELEGSEAWEVCADPIRPLLEAARTKPGAEVLAVATTHETRAYASIPTEGLLRVTPDEANLIYDFTDGGETGGCDRLEILSPKRWKEVRAVPEERRAAQLITMAVATHSEIDRASSVYAAGWDARERAVTGLRAGGPGAVSQSSWTALEQTMTVLTSGARGGRRDVTDIPLGAPLPELAPRARQITTERWITEAVMAARGRADMDALDDSVYAWALVKRAMDEASAAVTR